MNMYACIYLCVCVYVRMYVFMVKKMVTDKTHLTHQVTQLTQIFWSSNPLSTLPEKATYNCLWLNTLGTGRLSYKLL